MTCVFRCQFPRGLARRFIASSQSAYELQPAPSCCDLIPNGIDLEQ